MPELVSGVSGRFYEEIEGYENPVSCMVKFREEDWGVVRREI